MSQKSGARFTEKQGHYLAFIHTYAYMFGRPPAEADIQRHFRVSPPTVHQMIVTLERNAVIRRQPGVPRSIEILAARKLADSRMARYQNVKITVMKH
jgi:repressor LexA